MNFSFCVLKANNKNLLEAIVVLLLLRFQTTEHLQLWQLYIFIANEIALTSVLWRVFYILVNLPTQDNWAQSMEGNLTQRVQAQQCWLS